MFDLLGAVPAQQVQHGGVGAPSVELVRVQHPVAEEGRVVLDRRDQRDPLHEPPPARPARRQGPVAQQLLEQPVHLRRVGGRVQAQPLQVGQHVVVGGCVHGLLPDEADDVRAQLLVLDVRQHLLVDVDEPALARGEQQVQHVDHVTGEGVLRQPVQRGVLPAEGHVPGPQVHVFRRHGDGRERRIRHGVNVLMGRGEENPSARTSCHRHPTGTRPASDRHPTEPSPHRARLSAANPPWSRP